MKGELKLKALRKIIANDLADSALPAWSPRLINELRALPHEEVVNDIRIQWQFPGNRDGLVQLLARQPAAEDRAKFITGLSSIQGGVTIACAKALMKLEGKASPAEVREAMGVLRRYCLSATYDQVCGQLAKLLTHWTGQTFAIKDSEKGDALQRFSPWFDWFAKTYPKEAATLRRVRRGGSQAVEEATGEDRLEQGRCKARAGDLRAAGVSSLSYRLDQTRPGFTRRNLTLVAR